MIKFVAIAALATAIASPALAAHPTRHHRSERPADAYARSEQQTQRGHSANSSYDVYDTSGHYVGSDPDPLIRDMLRFDEGRHSVE